MVCHIKIKSEFLGNIQRTYCRAYRTALQYMHIYPLLLAVGALVALEQNVRLLVIGEIYELY
ncbi:hypothetical protein SPACI_017390 [Sporomusa acidovorans DSM 3132]|uniref:Uncharacterized protein n=1 Tax=Sporomusa acidovorans (strain ATCC 49682 / DSM 3132 / Mol) TaxID=1123286 RepID=A0ABZ3J0E7_SPOA4|nr:hypothetical protein SPACI_19370 [Sporomusa acidovorans DSM 3132]SDF84342.1 hypothetical protein SAMN04488499_10985 [Sporomusa acidovorans]